MLDCIEVYYCGGIFLPSRKPREMGVAVVELRVFFCVCRFLDCCAFVIFER